GDGGVAARAQDPASLNGKILRITRDGEIPADNPIWPPASEPSAVVSMGHRNPQGIAFAPGGQVYAAEHGPNVDDEINRIVPGANYGWPCYTGAGNPFMTAGCLPPAAYSAPAWASGPSTIATSGMTFLDHPSWEDWDGSAVVAQLKEQDLRRFTSSGGGATLTQADVLLDGDYGRLRAAVQAPDGSLYLTTSNGTADRVIRVTPGDVLIERYAGADRYATAAQVSSRTFAPGVPVAYVATGINYPDALAGGAAAARNGGPVLLVGSAGVPTATRMELGRLKPGRIVVLGGPGVISDAAKADLAGYAPGGASRLYGADRYATAAAISRATFSRGVPVVYVATGVDYPDALAGVPAAGVQRGPILLVRPTALPGVTATELGRLKPQRIVILGGTGAVSTTVASQLQAYTASPIQRRSGADRYATAVAISRATFAPGVPQVFIATGRNYPDGLTGGPAAALRGGPLLLVPGTSLPSAVSAELLRLDPRRVTILGGPGAVSDDVRARINALLND
ncbi:MAG TPA: cell wall-binding repeat-containing protein, partial [Candidatus Limnocylindria bacterium]